MAVYEVALVVIGLAILGAVVLPRLLTDRPLSFPILYVAGGILLFWLPLGIEPVNPVDQPALAERLTELVVIVALMGAGLKIDRPFDLQSWATTWRLLGIAMPLTIAATALLAWGVLGALPATALLLGAVVAPTDPVLASDVQTGPPVSDTDEEIDPADQEGSIRFALTSEAGLNDGLAFPFTYLAIAVAAAGTSGDWFVDWLLVDVVWRIGMGLVVGYVGGRVLAWLIFGTPSTTELARVMEGAEALAATLLTYGVAELLHGYGFIAVFVAALVLRHYEWKHEYYRSLHDFAVIVERLLMAAVLVLFGGALVAGLLAPLRWIDIAVGVGVVLLVRPLAGVLALLGSDTSWVERAVVAGFGVRGIGSFYYLSFALHEAGFAELELLVAADALWAVLAVIVLTSIVLHGVTASSVMRLADRWRDREPVTREG